MSRWQSALNSKLKEYRAQLTRKHRQEATISEYERLIWNAFEAFSAAGLSRYPRSIGADEIAFLQDELYAHMEPLTARNQVAMIGTFLKRCGNPIVESLDLEWPVDMRRHVKWLDPMKAMKLMRSAQGMERILIHCELCLLMRRVEVKRAEVRDFRDGRLDVWGKGRNGGKPRTIPWHPRTAEELDYYLRLREEVNVAAMEFKAPLPEALLVYATPQRVGAYADTAIDGMIKKAGGRAGLAPDEVSNHVLRRSGARILKRAGVPLITIMQTLGHTTERQTLDYIGEDLEEMAAGMQLSEAYMRKLECTDDGTKRD
jgi:integrase